MITRYQPTRRQFMQLMGMGTVAAVGGSPVLRNVSAATGATTEGDGSALEPVETGETRHMEISIEDRLLDVTSDFQTKVWGFNGQVPGPLIHVREGDVVEAVVHNNTEELHTIHWHGIPQTGSWRSDGAPGITEPGISSGSSHTDRFLADKPGTLWYHCHEGVPNHVGVRGMWGPLIVDPKDPIPIEEEVTKDAIVMFSGWNPDVADDFFDKDDPTGGMRYFSINGKAFPDNQPLRVREGDVLRLRLIAVSVDVAFHLHGHDVLVTHQDGLPLNSPEKVDVVYVAFGQRKDVIVRMNNPGRWPAHDHQEHHVSNDGKTPGGLMFVVEYEEIEHDPWYVWARKEYDPDFYFQESLQKGYGLIEQPSFEGKPL